MAVRLNEAHQAFFDALHLTPFDASRVRVILTPQDWELVKQVHGLPFAYEIYSRLWHLRQLESAINTMANVSEDIERHLRTLEIGVGEAGELLADRFVTDAAERSPAPSRTFKIYRPPVEDEPKRFDREPMEEAARASKQHEIGELPAPEDLEGRLKVASNFKAFCQRYFPEICNQWKGHHDVMADIVDSASDDRQLRFQTGVRGRGVTTQCALAALFALLYGRFQYLAIVSRTKEAACHILGAVKDELTCNPLLIRDFPEVCHPLIAAKGVSRRKLQTHRGQRTAIRWTTESLTLPTMAGSFSSGSRIEARSVKGPFIGMARTMPEGERIRPQFVLVDDPLTDADIESANRLAELEHDLQKMLSTLPGAKGTLSGVLYFTPQRKTNEPLDENDHAAASRVRGLVQRLASRFQR